MNALREELADVLRRAHEIQEQTRLLAATDDEIEAFVSAAEEAGLSRDATLQALRERLSYSPDAFKENELAFAKSENGAYYIARVLSSKDGRAKVRYCTGAEDTVSVLDLRSFSMTPGRKVQYFSPSSAWWFEAEVVRVNQEGGSVTVRCWGMEETVPFEKVRLPRDRQPSQLNLKVQNWVAWCAVAAGGGVVGAALTWLLSR